MTAQPFTATARRTGATVPGDLTHDTMPSGLTPGESYAYRRGYDAAARRLSKSGELTPPAVVHDGDAPAAGTAARVMLGRQLAAAGHEYRAARHARCHAGGMSYVRSYLRKSDKLAGQRRALTGEPDPATPYGDRRWQEITGDPGPRRRTRPAAVVPVPEPVTPDPAPVEPDPAPAPRPAGRLWSVGGQLDAAPARTRDERPGVIGTAYRVHRRDAARHYADGGAVLVSTAHADEIPVGDSTVWHARTPDTDGWDELVATVKSYGDRRQRFYVVAFDEPAADPRHRPAAADEPAVGDSLTAPVGGSLPVPGADELAAAGRLHVIRVTDGRVAVNVPAADEPADELAGTTRWHRMPVHGDVAVCGWISSDRDHSTDDMPAGGTHPTVTCPDCLSRELAAARATYPASTVVPNASGGPGYVVPNLTPEPTPAAVALADGTAVPLTRGEVKTARRELADTYRRRGVPVPAGAEWYRACLSVGIPVPAAVLAAVLAAAGVTPGTVTA